MYEEFPRGFTDVVPKSHNNLIQLIEFYKQHVLKDSKKRICVGKEKQWIDMFKQN